MQVWLDGIPFWAEDVAWCETTTGDAPPRGSVWPCNIQISGLDRFGQSHLARKRAYGKEVRLTWMQGWVLMATHIPPVQPRLYGYGHTAEWVAPKGVEVF